jgi:hypothetical protein
VDHRNVTSKASQVARLRSIRTPTSVPTSADLLL